MPVKSNKMFLTTFCAFLLILAFGVLFWFGNKVNGFSDLVDKAKANSEELEVALQVNFGNYSDSEGDVLHFDNGFVVLRSTNVFAKTEDLTLKVFILPELNEKGAAFLCVEEFCKSVRRYKTYNQTDS